MKNIFIWIAGALVSGLFTLFLMFSKKVSLKDIFNFFTKPCENQKRAEEQGH